MGRPAKQVPLTRPNDEARKQASFTKIAQDGRLRGPDLPEDVEWHPRTVTWWQTWRLSAQAQTWQDTDWDFLLDTAVLHSAFWSGKRDVAAELRLRVAKFGATTEDRMRLRVQAVGGDAPSPIATQSAAKPPAKSSARRRRILKAVGDGG